MIDRRFRGPAESANGGYTAGLLAQWIDGPAEVTLRLPPPLDRPLTVVEAGCGAIGLRDGDSLVAEARPAEPQVEPPPPIGLAQAEQAAQRYFAWEHGHPFPECFVCGTERAPGDGLRIFCGPVDGAALYAGSWTPDRALAGEDGLVRSEYVWAALDCPTGNALLGMTGADRVLLGRFTVALQRHVEAGAPHVLVSRPLGSDGRKHHAAAALYSADGELRGVSQALWIEPRG